jgi:16S rRNA (guanine966-N2)-methyltransferase
VKQSLFDILAPGMEGAVVIDLFAGTGSMGLECLSRGASYVVFHEADRSAVKRLRRNLDLIGVSKERFGISPHDIFKTFNGWSDVPTKVAKTATLVFLDPPYRFLRERTEALRQLAGAIAQRHLAPGGVVVFRHDAADALELPGLHRYDSRTYGGMMLEFLTPAEAKGDAVDRPQVQP